MNFCASSILNIRRVYHPPRELRSEEKNGPVPAEWDRAKLGRNYRSLKKVKSLAGAAPVVAAAVVAVAATIVARGARGALPGRARRALARSVVTRGALPRGVIAG